jgi:nitrate reductase gamma subunit
MSDQVLFGDVPFVAGVCLIAALLFKLLVGSADREATPPRPRRAGISLLTVAFAGTLAGHVAIVAWPAQVLAWNRSASRLLTLELTFFLFGLLALVGLIRIVIRDMRDSTRCSPRSLARTIVLALSLVAVGSGLAMAVGYRWASSWSSLTLTPWLRSVLRLQPEAQLVDTLPYVVKLHLFAGLALLPLLPLTSAFQIVDTWVGAIGGALDAWIGQALRRRCGPLLDGARQTWRGLLSPERDD